MSLGSQHPFVAADRELRQGAAGLALTALFVVVASAAGYPGRTAAVAVPGALVLIALLMRVGLLADVRRQRALDLVMAGDETLPIPAVVSLRRSLLGRRRTLTVRRLGHILDDALAHRDDPAACPSPILAVREEVAEIAVLLSSTHSARAVGDDDPAPRRRCRVVGPVQRRGRAPPRARPDPVRPRRLLRAGGGAACGAGACALTDMV